MKAWRIITAAAAVALTAAPAAFALGNCGPNLKLVLIGGLTICAERQNTTSGNVGNLYPWINSSFFFGNYRNQYLYPSSAVAKVSAIATTIESVHARSVSFTGASVNNYTSSYVRFSKPPASTLVRTFALNLPGSFIKCLPGNNCSPLTTGTIRVEHTAGTNDLGPNSSPSVISTFASEPGTVQVRDGIVPAVSTQTVPAPNLMMDHLIHLSPSGNSGFGVWDLTSGACTEPQRAYGSGQFANPNFLTTAYGVDNMAFVWVFRGLALPPPASVQQQVAEIIRLLLTPESVRCSGIDLEVNGKLDDNAFAFPDGKDYDPIMPRVDSGGTQTGEELDHISRSKKWNP